MQTTLSVPWTAELTVVDHSSYNSAPTDATSSSPDSPNVQPFRYCAPAPGAAFRAEAGCRKLTHSPATGGFVLRCCYCSSGHRRLPEFRSADMSYDAAMSGAMAIAGPHSTREQKEAVRLGIIAECRRMLAATHSYRRAPAPGRKTKPVQSWK